MTDYTYIDYIWSNNRVKCSNINVENIFTEYEIVHVLSEAFLFTFILSLLLLL